MKKTLLAVLAVTGFTTAFAQITLTSESHGIAPGMVAFDAVDTLFQYTDQGTGMGLTWDFEGLDYHEISETTFLPNTGTNFPDATFTFDQDGSTVYGKLTGSDMSILGFEAANFFNPADPPVIVENNPAQLLLNFPAVYGTVFDGQNNYSFEMDIPEELQTQFPAEKIRVTNTEDYTVSFDADGTANSPMGVFGVLKSTKVSTGEQIVEACLIIAEGIPCQWQEVQNNAINTTEHTFYVEENAFPLVTVFEDIEAGTTVTTFNNDPTLVSINEHANIQNFQVYPNPAVNEINFDQDVKEARIYDITGKLLVEVANVKTVDVSALSSGHYTVKTTDYSNTVKVGNFVVKK